MSYERLRPTFTFDADRIAQLRAIAPEAFADGAINWEALRAALGDHVEDEGADAEHFGLFWPGKRAARRRASEPSRGTLIPVPGEGVDEETTRNIFIEADNLDALKLLQKAYAGRVKMIYIDPPYNTGNDFVYRDDFREASEDYLRRTGQVDESLRPLTTNARTGGRFHSNWLNMIYPRLLAARTMLRDDGVIFVSIDDNEVHNLRQVMDELFGAENFIAQLVWEGGLKNDSRFISESHDYIVCYVLRREYLTINQNQWRTRKEGIDDIYAEVKRLIAQHKDDFSTISLMLQAWYRQIGRNHPAWQHRHYNQVDNLGVFFPGDISWPGGGGPQYVVYHPDTKKPVKQSARGWVFPKPEGMEKAIRENRVFFGPDENTVPKLKRYLHETEGQVIPSVLYKDRRAAMQKLRELFDGLDVFDNPKDVEILSKLVEAVTSDNDIVLDFFAGSGTTAHAVMAQNAEDGGNRQFILVQLPEETGRADYPTISAITAERIRRAGRKIAEERAGKLPDADAPPLDLGFRFFRFAPSNYRAWQDFDGDDLRQLELAFDGAVTPLIDGWQPENLLTEVMLHLGFPLDSRIEALPAFTANAVQRVTSHFHAHSLFACFDATIAQATIDALALGEEDIFVCLDSALTDQAKARLADVCNLRTI